MIGLEVIGLEMIKLSQIRNDRVENDQDRIIWLEMVELDIFRLKKI